MKYEYEKAKAEYRLFCDKCENDIQIFATPKYLDASCEQSSDWQVILYKENGIIRAAFPFVYVKTGKFWEIKNSFQGSRIGIWIDYSGKSSPAKRHSFTKEVVSFVIENLPYYDSFSVSFDHRFNDWHGFFCEGYSQTIFYSHVIYCDRDRSLDDVLAIFQKYRRKEISKALEKYTVDDGLSVDEFYHYMEKCYSEKGKNLTFQKTQFTKLMTAAIENHFGGILCARNDEGVLCAALGYVYDKQRTYTIFIAHSKVAEKETSARALLDYYCMLDAFANGRDFDFEGSMIPGVAEYNSRFNAIKEPYYIITKKSKRLQRRICLKALFKGELSQ